MVATIGSLVFVAAMFAALAVILGMIGRERDRMLSLLAGTTRDVVLPPTISLRARTRTAPRSHRTPLLHAAA